MREMNNAYLKIDAEIFSYMIMLMKNKSTKLKPVR